MDLGRDYTAKLYINRYAIRIMIEVKNLHKSFGDAHIIKGISTSFDKGKTNLIIGASGSGKTVFLKCLLGLYSYEKGTISYDGRIYTELSEDAKRDLRAKIGMP